ncbi:NtaA/DmoA family FMN-dependent monooxygenase [Caballeronia sp. LZ043]|uniref:NtaA/DmoA family FMN-dependent monooxygenase n=1 Tax=Caballeronia sp. LZ043 TaxID=3038569 RepID=UPI00285B8868|nr:NtaA/DmoA family FMN-dependent monooxygenase [Caballeronia sp. LZ043]MDR5822633.1 NtaA/DmoA family FMN-dependent monooxygenase [Caballeronia sp. LZ043]
MRGRRSNMVLSGFLAPGGYDARAWRLPTSRSGEIGTVGIVKAIAQRYEAAKLDSVFVADIPGADFLLDGDLALGSPYESISTMGALAAVTERIGIIGTLSTTFNQPFTIARQLAALDLLSGGRVGWNIVTSTFGADAHGIALPAKSDRYRRAAEFVGLVRELWSAWSDDAVINDKQRGHWLQRDKVKPLDYAGEFFRAKGALNIPRSPQGHPVLVQAGQSAEGLNFGAEFADIIYTTQPDKDQAIQYYREQKERVVRFGRDPDHVKVLPGLIPYVGRTDAEARDLFESIIAFMDFQDLRERFRAMFSVSLDGLALDQPVPAERFDVWRTHPSGPRILAYRTVASQPGSTLRDLLINFSSAMGHLLICGSAEAVAEQMIAWFEARACDGFSLNAPTFPDSVDAICAHLVPALQEKGYARRAYEADTLRGHLHLPRPKAWDGDA